ncbi:hypothetical protein [Limibacterium fermenti]|mgnify:CR=1 FL=1|uniref:hypothetical protein n=1 Tax=Limibacterium fermenti TaxID=3229863 RepID=UPI000E93AB8B|nr:hypothetical protein [Porphyromonadaceae bacterium]
MDKYRQISELMKGFQQNGQAFFPATVESVEGNTCTVVADGLSISDVRLKPTTEDTDNAFLMTPEIASDVLVGSISGDYSNLFIVYANSYSDIRLNVDEISFKLDKNGIIINDGENGGSVKIKELVEWMKKVYNDLQALKNQLQSHPVSGNGAPLALIFNSSTPNPNQSTFEDEKVKH